MSSPVCHMPGRGLAEPTCAQSVASFPSLLAYHTLLNTLCSVAQSYPTLCNPMDCSPPGSSVYRIFQARILGWAAISFRGLVNPGMEPSLLPSPALAGGFFTTVPPGTSISHPGCGIPLQQPQDQDKGRNCHDTIEDALSDQHCYRHLRFKSLGSQMLFKTKITSL